MSAIYENISLLQFFHCGSNHFAGFWNIKPMGIRLRNIIDMGLKKVGIHNHEIWWLCPCICVFNWKECDLWGFFEQILGLPLEVQFKCEKAGSNSLGFSHLQTNPCYGDSNAKIHIVHLEIEFAEYRAPSSHQESHNSAEKCWCLAPRGKWDRRSHWVVFILRGRMKHNMLRLHLFNLHFLLKTLKHHNVGCFIYTDIPIVCCLIQSPCCDLIWCDFPLRSLPLICMFPHY